MSLLAILAGGRTAAAPAASTPPPGTAVDPDALPTPADTMTAQLRPTGRSIGTLRVGPTRAYKTLPEAAAKAKNIQSATMATEGATTLTPNYRVDIIVDPGVYDQGMQGLVIPEFTAWYAADTTPHSTTVVDGLNQGANVYWEGVDIERRINGLWEPKYAFHFQVGGTTILANCRLTNSDPASGGAGTWAGMDGSNNGALLFYNVDGVVGTPTLTQGTNLHGAATNTAPNTVMYVDCTSNGALAWSDLGSGQASQVWIVGTSAQGIVADSYAPSATIHLAPSSVVTANSWNGALDTRADWPIPVGGLSPYWRAQLGL